MKVLIILFAVQEETAHQLTEGNRKVKDGAHIVPKPECSILPHIPQHQRGDDLCAQLESWKHDTISNSKSFIMNALKYK